MAIKDLPKYKDIRGTIRRNGRYPYVGTAVKDTHVIHHSLTLQHLAGSNPYSFANTHIDTNGWPGCAYVYVIMPDGTIYQTDDLDRRLYHAGNTNTRSIGTCLVGDFRKGKEKPTQVQMESLYLLNDYLMNCKEVPNMKYVKGHQECPGYDWKNCPGDNWNYKKVIDGTLVASDDSPVKVVSAPGTYTIQEGDTFWGIANHLKGVTVNDLKAANPGVDPTKLRVGQKINLEKASKTTAMKPAAKASTKSSGIKSIGNIQIVNVNSAAIVMDKPDRNIAKNLGTLKKGTKIAIAGSVKGKNNPEGYWEVIFNGKRAYVSGQYGKMI